MSDPPPDVCEICGEGPVEIVLYPVAVHYKGSGFYSTDYGKGSRKPTKEETKTTSDGGGEGGGGKKDEKKAAAAD
jgi:predicted nucleic acid-binding Zn ribbon protein